MNLRVNILVESDGRVDEAEDTCTTEEDTFDILDPVNILEKLPPNFYQLARNVLFFQFGFKNTTINLSLKIGWGEKVAASKRGIGVSSSS